jgi:two-component system chemotaxis response regulator CheY
MGAMPSGSQTQLSPSRFSVLVVDDFPTMVKMIRLMLLEMGFTNVLGVNDGNDALRTLRRAHYHLVISDLRMKEMDGLTLLREIRADARLKDVPFIMVTAVNDVELVAQAGLAGTTGYIVKPFTSETLKAKVEAALGRIA